MAPALTTPRGAVLRGRVRPGGSAADVPDGVVILGADGRIAALGPARSVPPPPDLPGAGGPGAVVMAGLVDAHVHLACAPGRDSGTDSGRDSGTDSGLITRQRVLAGAVVAVRDLGAPPALARRWRTPPGTTAAPTVAVAGPLLTAPGGYPSRSWGADGFTTAVDTPAEAGRAVAAIAAGGADLVKLALEPAGGRPVPSLAVASAVVHAAHHHGLAVTCHALTAGMLARALDAGVDELCHVPLEPLPDALVQRLAGQGVAVVSTLHTHVDAGHPSALDNARALVRAGVPLVYGTDLGNAGTEPGADPRELDLLVTAGLTRAQALLAATEAAAGVPGLSGRGLGTLRLGRPAAAVVLPGDPLTDFAVLRRPLAVATPLPAP